MSLKSEVSLFSLVLSEGYLELYLSSSSFSLISCLIWVGVLVLGFFTISLVDFQMQCCICAVIMSASFSRSESVLRGILRLRSFF